MSLEFRVILNIALQCHVLSVLSVLPCPFFISAALHYENTPIQSTVIFHGCKNDYFQMKIVIYFLIFAQNIDCGYMLVRRF